MSPSDERRAMLGAVIWSLVPPAGALVAATPARPARRAAMIEVVPASPGLRRCPGRRRRLAHRRKRRHHDASGRQWRGQDDDAARHRRPHPPRSCRHASIDGIDAQTSRMAALKRLGFFADRFGLYLRASPRASISNLPAHCTGFRCRALNTAVDRAIALLDMGAIAGRRTAGMSQGQQVKIALGRAIVHRPPNLILDEPTRGLDIFAVRLLRALLKHLRDEGVCILPADAAGRPKPPPE